MELLPPQNIALESQPQPLPSLQPCTQTDDLFSTLSVNISVSLETQSPIFPNDIPNETSSLSDQQLTSVPTSSPSEETSVGRKPSSEQLLDTSPVPKRRWYWDFEALNSLSRKLQLSSSSSGDSDDEVFQAGGHGRIKRSKPGWIMKKTIPAECEFYNELQVNTAIPDNIKEFFPKVSDIGERHLVLEDLTDNFCKPCVMDVKMGTRTYGEDATPMKKSYMMSQDKSTTTFRYGLRIIGLRTYNNLTAEYVSLSRVSANSIFGKNKMDRKLYEFFHNGDQFRSDIVEIFLKRLETLYNWMESQNLYRFYSSSLLFVYEGEGSSLKADVRMIDFAHVFPIKDGGTDEGYVKGLATLMETLRTFVMDGYVPSPINS